MALGFAAGVVNTWLDSVFATANCYVKLHTADPGAAGATAAAAGDTTRKQATMGAASGGSKAASASVGPWTNGGTSETISHISLWSAAAAGTFNASGALGSSQAWVSTNTLTLTALTVSITSIAA
jgi:hypothetical protein